MRLSRLPRCEAITAKGNPCRGLEAVPGSRRCKYHGDPALRDATIARNTAAFRAYMQRRKAAKLAAAGVDAAEAAAAMVAAHRSESA
jgi:hypothetical protein